MEALVKIVDNMDQGFYIEARKNRQTALEKFATLGYKEGIGPTEVEADRRCKEYLRRYNQQDDGSRRAEKIRKFSYDTWYMEKAFAEVGCPLRGAGDMTVQKAFELGARTQSLFPTFYENRIVAGILAEPVLDMIVAETVDVDQPVINHVTLNETKSDRSTGLIGELTSLPEVTVSATDATVRLKEFGSILKMSDHAMKQTRIPLVARFLERHGRQLANDVVDFGIDVLGLGDGTAAAASSVAAVGTPATYTEWVSLVTAPSQGYRFNTLITPILGIRNILNTAEFKDPLAGFAFQNAGIYPKPFGLDLVRWDATTSASSFWSTPGTKVLVIQRELALIQYTMGGVQTETDRIINGRFTEQSTVLTTGFTIGDSEARRQGTGTYAG